VESFRFVSGPAETGDAQPAAPLLEATFRLAEAYCEPVVQRHFPGATLEEFDLDDTNWLDRFAKVYRLTEAEGAPQILVLEANGFGGANDGSTRSRNVDGVLCEMGTTDYFIEILALMARRGERPLVGVIEEAAREGRLRYMLVDVVHLDDQNRVGAGIAPYIVHDRTIGNLTW